MKNNTTTILIATGALLFGGIATAAYMNNRDKPAEFVNATTGEPVALTDPDTALDDAALIDKAGLVGKVFTSTLIQSSLIVLMI